MEKSLDFAASWIAGPAFGQTLTDRQMIKPAELTQKKADYYQKLTDPEIARNFLITRSFVRLCQQVIDRKLPPRELPDKPLGFSARYLLAGEATMINSAISESLAAELREMAPAKR